MSRKIMSQVEEKQVGGAKRVVFYKQPFSSNQIRLIDLSYYYLKLGMLLKEDFSSFNLLTRKKIFSWKKYGKACFNLHPNSELH